MKFLKTNYRYFLCFFIPAIILLIIFKESKIYPFGDYSYLYSDLFQQYMPFLVNLEHKLANSQSLAYSWNLGLGLPFSPILSYYLTSPANLIIMLIDSSLIADAIDIMIIIKISLCAVTFCYYLSKNYENRNLLTVSISLCYALSSYVCTYCFNIIWLDALILFPLIVLGIQYIYEERKYKLYFFSLFITILSNYYIAIIICIFSLLYFLLLIFVNEKQLERNYLFTSIKLFFAYSLLAGLTSAIAIFPAMIALSSTASGEFSFPKTIDFYISFIDLITRFSIIVPKEIGDNFPNLYCSVIILLAIPLYVLNKKIKKKSKCINLSILVFMLISFNTNILDYIWHGFHFTNSICTRNSFIFIFFVLTVSYEALSNIEYINNKSYIISVMCTILYIAIIWKFQINGNNSTTDYKENIIFLTIFFVLMYFIFTFIIVSGFKQTRIIHLLLLLTISYELYMNAGVFIYSTNNRSSFIDSYNKVTDYTKKLRENNTDFFRIEQTSTFSPNDGALMNYNSASCFSSTANNHITDFYKALGLEASTNYFSFYGHTPVTASILGVKYLISSQDLSFTDIPEFYTRTESTDINCYKYNYALPIGFMVPPSFSDVDLLESENPFDNLNSLYQTITNQKDNIFNNISYEKNVNHYEFMVTDNKPVYFKYNSPIYCQIMASIHHNDGTIEQKPFNYLSKGYISYLGELERGETVAIKISNEKDEYHNLDLYVCSFDKDKMELFYSCASKNMLNVLHYTDTSIDATINSSESGIIFTSIPYDKHWDLYVDGKKTSLSSYKDTFITFNLNKGDHTIALEYNSSYNYIGVIITALSAITFIILEIYYQKRKKDQ